jgi:hypothetical protein
MCAVQVGDRGDQAQPEAMARAMPTALEAVKPPQNVSVFVDRNSRPAVA